MTAVCTYQNTAEHIAVSFFGFPFTDFSTLLLNLLPNGTLNNRLVNIFEDDHIFRIILDTLFVFIGFGICFEVNHIATVFLCRQNFDHSRIEPLVGGKVTAFPGLFDTHMASMVVEDG